MARLSAPIAPTQTSAAVVVATPTNRRFALSALGSLGMATLLGCGGGGDTEATDSTGTDTGTGTGTGTGTDTSTGTGTGHQY